MCSNFKKYREKNAALQKNRHVIEAAQLWEDHENERIGRKQYEIREPREPRETREPIEPIEPIEPRE